MGDTEKNYENFNNKPENNHGFSDQEVASIKNAFK